MTVPDSGVGGLGNARVAGPRAWPRILAAGLAILVAAVALTSPGPQSPWKVVHLAASDVILSAADMPQVGWGLRASGTNGTGVWRLFAAHNELLIAILNVTLWVDADVETAAMTLSRIAGAVGYPLEDGQVTRADASLFWYEGSTAYAGMAVRRYNVAFLLSAILTSSFALTRSDLERWAGWQLTKIEAAAA